MKTGMITNYGNHIIKEQIKLWIDNKYFFKVEKITNK